MQKVGVKVGIEADTSNAKAQIEELNGAIKKLDDNSRNIPRFMGSGAGSLRPGEAAAVPAQIMPASSFHTNDQKYVHLTEKFEKLSKAVDDVSSKLQKARDNNDVEKESKYSRWLENATSGRDRTKRQLNEYEQEAIKTQNKTAAIPENRIAEQIMPRTAPNLTGQSMYGVNSFYGQISPGGILPDGRRTPNAQFNIEQVKDQIEGLGEVIEGLTRDMQEAWKNGDFKTATSISSALENAKHTELSMRNQVKNAEREEQVLLDRGNPMKQFGSYMGAHLAMQLAQSFVSAGNIIMGSQKTLAGGDYAGAMVQREKGIGQLIGSGGGTLLGGLIGSFVPGGTLIGAGIGNILGNFLGGIDGDIAERNLAFSGQYKNALPGMESFYQRFGGNIAGRSGGENSSRALGWYNRASKLSYGTGHTTEELMQAAQNKAAYGNISGERALTLGRQDLMWERLTGANLGNIQRVSGLAMRYDGDTDAMQRAYAGLQASGMGKGQFDEFLTSMQRIMEDGIEKGFVRGADEIAGNMTMLSKLSGGNPLWTGEQGAKRLGQMNESMYNATNLRTIEDTISFSAVNSVLGVDDPTTDIDERELNFYRLNGGKNEHSARYSDTYVDNMLIMERGMQPEIMAEQMKAVQAMEGDNYAGQIERYRIMYGLNYTGADQVYKMSQDDKFLANPEKYRKEVDRIKTNVDYKSDAQKLSDAITTLTTQGVNMGKITFDTVEIPKLYEATEEMKKIYEQLRKLNGEEDKKIDNRPQIAKDFNISAAELEKYGPGDYTPLIDAFINSITPVTYNPGNSTGDPDMKILHDNFSYSKLAKYGDKDTKVSRSEVNSLLPWIQKILEKMGADKYRNINLMAYLTGEY